MNVEAKDLMEALKNQRNAAFDEAAMNYALAQGYEKRIKELEAQLAERDGNNN